MTIAPRPKVLGLDLDGTLLEHEKFPKYGKPIDGMKEQIEAIRQCGWKVAIWTCRNADEYGNIEKHLAAHGIEVDYINENPHEAPSTSPKIYADVYLDDRGMRFDGNTQGLAERVMNHKRWFDLNPLGVTSNGDDG